LVAVLGAPFFYQQVTDRLAASPEEDRSITIQMNTAKTAGDAVEVDKAYREVLAAENQRDLERAKASTGSTIPTPLSGSGSDEISLPEAPKQAVADPLAEWRRALEPTQVAKPEAKGLEEWRQSMGGAKEAPARAEADMAAAPAKSDKDFGGVQKNKAEPLSKKLIAQDQAVPSTAVAPAEGYSREVERIAPVTNGLIAQPVPVSPPVDIIAPQGYQDVGRDQFQKFEENSVKNVAAEPVSTFSIDVDTASYSFARKAINQGYLPQANAIRIEEMINYFDYDYAVPEEGGHPFQPTVAVYDSPWRSGTKLVHVGIKGYELQKEVKSNLVFLIDTSGSMNSQDKLPLLVNSFKLMLDNLSPDDTVGIVVYAGSAGTVLEPTKVADKHKILQSLERLSAGGSTAGAAGIQQAYALAEQSFIKDGNNRIILATDGDFNVGITNRDELKTFVERKRDQGISLSVLGFGQGNYNDHMMQVLAQNGNGNAAYIDSLSEARKVLVEEASSTLFTIAKDVKVQVEFNPALVQEYRLIGYETRHLNREDFNNDKVDAGEIGAGHTVTAIYEITPTGMQPMVDDLRYQKPAPRAAMEEKHVVAPAASGDEYAFLKIRYKRPDENTSILMTRPITKSDEKSFESLSDDLRFANAVAGFAQLLKGSKFTGNLTYDQVIEIANAARGKDEFGYRTEFVNLVRLAKSAAAMQNMR
jgi:Ca-activated chloride channel family protein